MAYDYIGSIAQKYIQFVTTVISTSTPGLNFGKVMIFLSSALGAANFAVDPGVDTITELTQANYKTLAIGTLLAWATDFYAAGSTTSIFVVTYTDGAGPVIADLSAQYALYDERAYWKTVYSIANRMAAGLALATLCTADPLSQFFWSSADATILTNTAGNESLLFSAAALDVPIIYHPTAVASHNAALVQLGNTLAALNTSGTYVGNKLDFLGLTYTASGTAGANVSAAGLANCVTLGVAVFTTLGNGTGKVALEGGAAGIGWITGLNDTNIGARWMVNYIDTVSSILVTQYLAMPGRFKNNDTYQGCLVILQTQLNLFSGMGRLSGVQVTAPPFAQLPAAAGGVITVPYAWVAYYNDNLRQVTVYGTLYISV
jgi:hypothetical protein